MKIKSNAILSMLLSVNLGLAAAGMIFGSSVLAASAQVDKDQAVGSATVGELQEANSRETLCEKYGWYSVRTENWYADETREEENYYISGDQVVLDDQYITQIRDDRKSDVYGYDKDQKKGFRYLFIEGAFDDFVKHNAFPQGFTATGKETFQDDDSKEGEMAVTATVSDLSRYDAEYFDNFGYSKNDIASMTVKYVFDDESYETLSMKSLLKLKDGNQVTLSSSTFSYATEAYQPDAGITEMISGNNSRSLSVTTDPGTSREAVYSQTVQKGNMIMFYPFNGYMDLFTDSNCTQEYVSSETDDQKDIHTYTKAK